MGGVIEGEGACRGGGANALGTFPKSRTPLLRWCMLSQTHRNHPPCTGKGGGAGSQGRHVPIGVAQLFWYDESADAAHRHARHPLLHRRNDGAGAQVEVVKLLVVPREGAALGLCRGMVCPEEARVRAGRRGRLSRMITHGPE